MTTTTFRAVAAVLALAAIVPAAAHAELPSKPVLTLEAARRVGAAAYAEAVKRNATVVIAVVDDGGHVVFLERLNDTQVASVDVGIGKARTAAIFRRPSKVFEDQIREGRVASLVLPGATPLQGGIPLEVNGRVIGAIGVSGNTPQEDEDIAKAGAAALRLAIGATEGPPVSYWNSREVTQAFAKGSVLFDGEDGRNYMVHASHREGPGMVELHAFDADIIHVLEGSATLVTGGTVENAAPTGPGEIRGTAIANGEERLISKGDVLIIPAGTPHWFKSVPGALDYYVVKVR
jgi:glc operon protein GlcG